MMYYEKQNPIPYWLLGLAWLLLWLACDCAKATLPCRQGAPCDPNAPWRDTIGPSDRINYDPNCKCYPKD